jgi:hypothetical protein
MRKKSNIIKRNSGFLVGCVVAAGVSGFTANTVMTNGLSVLTQSTETLEEQTTVQTVAEESTQTRVFETDPFTVTASGNIIKGVETEKETEKKETETESETEAAEHLELDEDGNIISVSADNNADETTTQDGSASGSTDGQVSASDGSSDTSYSGGTSYDGPAIEIYDTGNGDYYYTDDSSYTGNSGSTGNSGISSAVYTDFWSDSIFPETYSRYIAESELYNFSASEIRLIRNEIFARHGRRFNSSDLANYFAGKAWYVPTYSPEEFDANMDSYLNDYEKANLNVILNYEDALAGY